MFRSLDELRRDQQAILDGYRQERAARTPAVVESGGTPPGCELAYGRVVEVVAADPVDGPHLLVMRQAWSGTPSVPADAAVAPTRCYPSPVHTLADYAVDAYVRMLVTDGAVVAEPL